MPITHYVTYISSNLQAPPSKKAHKKAQEKKKKQGALNNEDVFIYSQALVEIHSRNQTPLWKQFTVLQLNMMSYLSEV